MQISKKDWSRYIKRLSAIDRKAADTMAFWMQENPDADVDELIWIAQNVAGRYGEAAGALACEMYDAVAAAQGAAVPPAEIADVPDYGETAKAVRGTMKNKQNTVPATVGRLVKRVGADTMLKNAERDHAQFAWIPMGDTCAFCMTLASRGWQYMSKAAMKHGHAEHIHANCDCQYAIRFDEKSTVEGYDPERYREMYDNAEGGTPQEKINSMRRAKYEQDKDRINAQKRAAYVKRKGMSDNGSGRNTTGKDEGKAENRVPDFYVGPNGKVLSSQYKEWIGDNQMQAYLEKAEGEEAKRYIKADFRRTSFIGDGSTAAIREFEIATGLNCGRDGNSHAKKVEDLTKQIKKALLNDLSDNDRVMLEGFLKRLEAVSK